MSETIAKMVNVPFHPGPRVKGRIAVRYEDDSIAPHTDTKLVFAFPRTCELEPQVPATRIRRMDIQRLKRDEREYVGN